MHLFNCGLLVVQFNWVWSVVLVAVVLLIIFTLLFASKKKRVSNKADAKEAEIVVLLGSESGTTRDYANLILAQFSAAGKKVFLTSVNSFKPYPAAQHMVFVTATYGDGDAPATASNYLHVLEKFEDNKSIPYSILGFGSKNYEQFCGFAFKLDEYLQELGYKRFLPVHTVNEKSVIDIVAWVEAWNKATGMGLSNSPQHYEADLPKMVNFKVTNIYKWPDSTDTFVLRLMPKRKLKIQSGDILNIYPKEDVERSYSIGMINGQVQLVVKLHEHGVGSQFLYQLKRGDVLPARVVGNTKFNLSKKYEQHIFIANGTGVAPFLGMMRADEAQNITLFAGFRAPSECNEFYTTICTEAQGTGALEDYYFAFSRVGEKQYVMDLIRQHTASIVEKVKEGACIYLCGSLAMQRDVEACLARIFSTNGMEDIPTLKERGQFKTDCY
jgi:sulfite reductase (NADPH) flavoprotein alpha-component